MTDDLQTLVFLTFQKGNKLNFVTSKSIVSHFEKNNNREARYQVQLNMKLDKRPGELHSHIHGKADTCSNDNLTAPCNKFHGNVLSVSLALQIRSSHNWRAMCLLSLICLSKHNLQPYDNFLLSLCLLRSHGQNWALNMWANLQKAPLPALCTRYRVDFLQYLVYLVIETCENVEVLSSGHC